jgi:membrane protease YdiL (CAAX protease family)
MSKEKTFNIKSIRIYISLIVILAILAGINVFLPQGDFIPMQEYPASRPVMAGVTFLAILIIYGGLGYIGVRLSEKLDFALIWDHEVDNKQRFLIPGLIGLLLGVFFILVDLLFSQYFSLEKIPHPPFPTSLVASAVAGIGEEIIFRLFFISFWVWLISYVILNNKHRAITFWMVAILSAIAFTAAHLPSILMLYDVKSLTGIPIPLLTELVILNATLSLLAAWAMKNYGLLAAVGIHFWTDIVWHVIWGLDHSASGW